MRLRDILVRKGGEVFSTSPTATLGDVVARLVENNCGALVVLEGERMTGIISERDVLKACAELDTPLAAPVESRMSSNVITGAPDDNVEHAMGLMTHHRIRHLPVLESERLSGVISIGDIVKAQYEALSDENRYLKQYIQG